MTPHRPPMTVHKKIQPNPSSHLAGYRQNIYLISTYIVHIFFSDQRNYSKRFIKTILPIVLKNGFG